jgi:hypothetical protein
MNPVVKGEPKISTGITPPSNIPVPKSLANRLVPADDLVGI